MILNILHYDNIYKIHSVPRELQNKRQAVEDICYNQQFKHRPSFVNGCKYSLVFCWLVSISHWEGCDKIKAFCNERFYLQEAEKPARWSQVDASSQSLLPGLLAPQMGTAGVGRGGTPPGILPAEGVPLGLVLPHCSGNSGCCLGLLQAHTRGLEGELARHCSLYWRSQPPPGTPAQEPEGPPPSLAPQANTDSGSPAGFPGWQSQKQTWMGKLGQKWSPWQRWWSSDTEVSEYSAH